MKDKNGNIIKIGDRIKNAAGEIRRPENIRGMTMAVRRGENNAILNTVVISKIDMGNMELVS